ncbi:transcription factor S-II (TFIIS) E4L [Salmon gill poxvirus]
MEYNTTVVDYIALIDSALNKFPEIKAKLNKAEDIEKLSDWLKSSVEKNAVLKFSETKQVLERTKFSNTIDTGLNLVLSVKTKSAFLTEPIYDQSMKMDKYSQSILEYKNQEKEEWQYLMYAFKCILLSIEYDENKLDLEDDYSSYFGTEEPTIIAECPRCKKTDVDIRLMQIRSIDEAATIKYVCNSCEHSFNPPSFNKVRSIIKT